MTTDIEKLRGDLHHLISPVIGALRMFERDEPDRMAHYIDRLYLALALTDEAATGEIVPDDWRGAHGVGLNHYPSLVSPESEPCLNPHIARRQK